MRSLQFQNYRDLENWLLEIPKFSDRGVSAANFSLKRMEEMSRLMGDPWREIPMIHVAGTNGKGTVCRMIASVLQNAGYRTGLYTSPHLIDIRERFRIDSEMINEEEMITFFSDHGEMIFQYNPTFFELTTLIAFWYFREKSADIAVIETGLGGRLDATNIIDPICSVITSVGLDHTDILGETLGEIAAEKAGIIKPGRPVVVGHLKKEAMGAVDKVARRKSSELILSDQHDTQWNGDEIRFEWEGEMRSFPSEGRKSVDVLNVATTSSVLRTISERFPVSADDIDKGFSKVNELYPAFAGFEKLHPGLEWYFDGAHNPEAIALLKEELLMRSKPAQWTVVLSFMRDKLTPEVAALWSDFSNISLVEMKGERAAKFEEMKELIPTGKKLNLEQEDQKLFLKGIKSELVIFSGSFYFYEKVRRWMGTMAAKK
ncbi:MAG: bifunctional folylpolyglutamate synthase/dihydrofolate synthase [Balneolaceae bacterium]|nr:bifunctional folylpolyglutamate synthase/dihydrofolate synthase [Balneolaceae bacterium]MCH8548597.1 bifunctional folylpolyglutamate synthase/dihydrofolate synthase [Balneolaceae bacterium]